MPRKIPSLDGIRALSCLFVIFGHFSYLYAPVLSQEFGKTIGLTIAYMFGNQYTGVTFFFVLSGFLITSILIEEHKKNDTISLKTFFIKRVFRIFPAYYFYFICILVWIFITKQVKVSNQDVFAAITYTSNYLSDLNPWQLAHFWSLSVEEQFYLVWPLMFLLFYKKLGVRLPWFIILISPLLRILTYFLFPEIRSRISILTHTRFDSLMFGCLLAYYYQAGKMDLINSYIKKYYLQYLAAFHIFCFSRFLQMSFQGKYVLIFGYTLDCFFMCVLIVFAVKNKSLFSKLLNLPIMIHLGSLSYSLYLWHIPFAWYEYGNDRLILRFFAIYLCALFSYLLIEMPFMSMRESYFRKKAN